MKTKLFILLLALSSCNMSKHYFQQRAGGHMKNILQNDELENTLCSADKNDSLDSNQELASNVVVDTSSVASEETVPPHLDTAESSLMDEVTVSENNDDRKTNIILPPRYETKKKSHPIQEIKSVVLPNAMTGLKDVDWKEVWFALEGILLVIGLLALLYYAFFLAGLTLTEMIMLVGLIALTILLLVGLSKLITGIFPGMSEKSSRFSLRTVLAPLRKRMSRKPKNSGAMKYYGMSVKGIFWIGTGIIVAGLILAMAFGAPVIVYDIIFGLFAGWAVCCLIAGAFAAIFEGIAG